MYYQNQNGPVSLPDVQRYQIRCECFTLSHPSPSSLLLPSLCSGLRRTSIASWKELTRTEQKKMCLSTETLQGLRITGEQNVHEPYHAVTISILSAAVTSFVEAARYLLQYPGFQFLLSERFTQDPLEAFFSMQRQKGGGSDNPTALQFTYNTSSLRIQRSTAPSARSNVRGSQRRDGG